MEPQSYPTTEPCPDGSLRRPGHWPKIQSVSGRAAAGLERADGRCEAGPAPGEVLGVAAHEIRSPLSSIRGIAEFLRDGAGGPLTPTQLELITIIHETSESVLAMVSDVLELAALRPGELKLELEWHDLTALTARCVDLMNAQAAAKRTRIVMTSGTAVRVRIDPPRMSQVINNLLDNAVKYSPPGSVVTVQVEPCPAEGACRLSVRDQGPGIPPGERHKLFSQFGRLSAKPTGGEKAVGLGLAISRRIVDAHQGTIDTENLAGGGCDFHVLLPLPASKPAATVLSLPPETMRLPAATGAPAVAELQAACS